MKALIATRSTTGTSWVGAAGMAALKFPVSVHCIANSTIDYDIVVSNDGQTTETNHATIVGATGSTIGAINEPVGDIGVNVNSVSGGDVTVHIVGQ